MAIGEVVTRAVRFPPDGSFLSSLSVDPRSSPPATVPDTVAGTRWNGDATVAKIGVVAAANAAGVSRSTINRYLKSGKLSATTDRDGARVIDTAELARVFGDLQPAATSRNGRKKPSQQPPATVALLEQQVAALERENATLRRELDAARDEKARLLALVEKGHHRLLTDQRTDEGAVVKAVRWLFGAA